MIFLSKFNQNLYQNLFIFDFFGGIRPCCSRTLFLREIKEKIKKVVPTFCSEFSLVSESSSIKKDILNFIYEYENKLHKTCQLNGQG
ncbi:hypothetical protein BpHYR1_030773 [Brachionus plicatilis]|uniref:Uncharacterized protein n=1 Tax=Brachionus plicatilis TaxID=10195 RepID=A0A3M7PHC1_BRAPC|nr:hypothetical protein BpHYR1_030773 [Brachionus plicatilis]